MRGRLASATKSDGFETDLTLKARAGIVAIFVERRASTNSFGKSWSVERLARAVGRDRAHTVVAALAPLAGRGARMSDGG